MAAVTFTSIRSSHAKVMSAAFDLIASGKRAGAIDEEALKRVLGPIYQEKFISTKDESEYWLAKWKENPEVDSPWDFGSWVDAFMNAEIDLLKIHVSEDGSGSIDFEQLAWPSGGVAAIKELVKAFGGTVVSSSAL